MGMKRVWLNPVASSDNGWIKYGLDEDNDGVLTFADCGRVINYNVSTYSKKECKRTINKINKMIHSLEEFKTIVEELREGLKK